MKQCGPENEQRDTGEGEEEEKSGLIVSVRHSGIYTVYNNIEARNEAISGKR